MLRLSPRAGLLATALALHLVGCGGETHGTDDAGSSLVDAGSSPDAGRPGSDAGSPRDDAALGEDGGPSGPDAGTFAAPDAGLDGGERLGDGGTSVDGGGATEGATFAMRRDTRRCASPLCGGWWVTAVNRAETLCADGTRAAECYVAELDWSPSAYSEDAQLRARDATGGVLLDAEIVERDFGAWRLGVLRVRGAWIAEWGTAVADPTRTAFHHLSDTGLRCLVDPCFSIEVGTLNLGIAENASGLDLAASGAPGDAQNRAQEALAMGVLRAAGAIQTDPAPGTSGETGRTYYATQFYLPL